MISNRMISCVIIFATLSWLASCTLPPTIDDTVIPALVDSNGDGQIENWQLKSQTLTTVTTPDQPSTNSPSITATLNRQQLANTIANAYWLQRPVTQSEQARWFLDKVLLPTQRYQIWDYDNDGRCDTIQADHWLLRDGRQPSRILKRFSTAQQGIDASWQQLLNNSQSNADSNSCRLRHPQDYLRFILLTQPSWAQQTKLYRPLLSQLIKQLNRELDQQRRQSAPQQCTLVEQLRGTHQFMLRHYLWRERLPLLLDYQRYSNVQSLLDDLKQLAGDRWSYLGAQQNDGQPMISADQLGFWPVAVNEQLYVAASSRKDIKRGDRIIGIEPARNTTDATSTLSWQLNLERGGKQLTIPYPKPLHKHPSILNSQSHPDQNGPDQPRPAKANKMGLLSLAYFDANRTEELSLAMQALASNKVRHLVLDLRYNRGGHIQVALDLAQALLPAGQQDTPLLSLSDGTQQLALPNRYQLPALPLDKLVVLTTAATSSAAEQLINVLKPQLDVTVIGQTTNGKPVTTSPEPICGRYLHLATGIATNSEQQPVNSDGIQPQCVVEDSLQQALDDWESPILKAASQTLAGTPCQPETATATTP